MCRRLRSANSPCANGLSMASATSGIRRKIGSAQPGPSTSIVAWGSRCLRSVSKGCDNSASPTHDGATTRILVIAGKSNSYHEGTKNTKKGETRKSIGRGEKFGLACRLDCATLENVASAAVGAQGLAVVANRQEHAR